MTRRREPSTGLLSGAWEALLTPALFVAAGLLVVGALDAGQLEENAGRAGSFVLEPGLRAPGASEDSQAREGSGVYPAEMVPEDRPPNQWLVDGFNVVSVGLLGERRHAEAGSGREGWWRREHREALVERARAFDDPNAEVWVVFDGGDPRGDRQEPPVRTVFARSADDWLLERVQSADAPESLTVVTADRRLASRVRSRGAVVVSPAAFLGRCRA